MKVQKSTTDSYAITVSKDELKLLLRSLNEIANGVKIEADEFETRTGFPKSDLKKLLNTLRSDCDKLK